MKALLAALYMLPLFECTPRVSQKEMRSATLRKYMQAVNGMYESQGFSIPIEWTDKENSSVRFLDAPPDAPM